MTQSLSIKKAFSVVIPIHNEVASLSELYSEINKIVKEHHYSYELILIDDGSTDKTWDVVKKIVKKDNKVRGIRLGRNFGKAAALNAGISDAKNEIIITMDSDLQDNPQDIPAFIYNINKGFDVVCGWRKYRKDKKSKIMVSHIFNYLTRLITRAKLHDINCGMKGYRRHIFHEIQLYGELHRFIPVLAASKGHSVTEIQVQHRERKYGQTKYGARRLVKGFIDLFTVAFLTKFGQRPQHIFGSIGAALILLSLLVLLSLVVIPSSVVNYFLLLLIIIFIAVLAATTGLQLIAIGFLAEIITAYHGQNYKPYSIVEQTRDIIDSQ